MKTLILSVLLISGGAVIPAYAEVTALSVSISVPSKDGEYVLDPGRMKRFHVIVSNKSDRPQSVWAPWSSASRGMLAFEFTDAAGRKGTIKRKEKLVVSRQLPEVCTLQPRESLVLDIDYTTADIWEGFPQATNGLPTITLRAIFEIRSSARVEGANGIWTGRIVSDPLKLTIYPE